MLVKPIFDLESVWLSCCLFLQVIFTYHHLFPAPSHGGIGTQLKNEQLGHGTDSPSPCIRITMVMMIKRALIIRPRHRIVNCLVLDHQFSCRPKNSPLSRSIVVIPIKNPYSRPPRSKCCHLSCEERNELRRGNQWHWEAEETREIMTWTVRKINYNQIIPYDLRVKLSTYGVSPIKQLRAMSRNRNTTTIICRLRFPFSVTKSENRCFQFIKISERQAPIKPKIPPDAPTVMYSGRKIALSIVPPMAGTMKRIAAAMLPWVVSIALPTNQMARLFMKKCTRPAWRMADEMRRQTSFSMTIRYESFAPIRIRVSELGPIIGFTARGSMTQPFNANDTANATEHVTSRKYVKNGWFTPFLLEASKSAHER